VAGGGLEGQHILVKWPEEDGGWVHAIVEKPYTGARTTLARTTTSSILKRLWVTPMS
jgi:hypothetical protein